MNDFGQITFSFMCEFEMNSDGHVVCWANFIYNFLPFSYSFFFPVVHYNYKHCMYLNLCFYVIFKEIIPIKILFLKIQNGEYTNLSKNEENCD